MFFSKLNLANFSPINFEASHVRPFETESFISLSKVEQETIVLEVVSSII